MYAPIIIATLIILANSWHVIWAWLHQPAGTYFTGIAHYFADYFLYTSLMTQKGLIFTHHLFTNEPLQPTWIYWFYTILGKLGNPFLVYNLSIIIFSAILLFLWWKIIQQLIPNKASQIIAFLFVTTASGFTGYDFWFSPLPALNRLGGVPHQMLQSILLLSVVLFASSPSLITRHLLPVTSFLAATANPIQMLLLSISLIIVKPKNMLSLLPAVIAAIITNTAFAKDPILLAAKSWENSQNIVVLPWHFFLGVGPIGLLIPFGVTPYMQNVTPIKKTILWYGLLSLLIFFSPIPTLLGTSPVRWLSPAAYGVLPILAAYGIQKIPSPITRHSLLILYIVFTIPSLINQIQSRMNPPRDLQYIPNEVVQKIQNLSGDGVVITDPKTPYDVIIPVFTGRKSFTGHPIHTLYPEVKEALRRDYFENTMTDEEKRQFLKDHHITTIFP